jgi:hypothetical protein
MQPIIVLNQFTEGGGPFWCSPIVAAIRTVVIKKEPNQLYGAVATVVGLGTTRERAKKDAEISSELDSSTTYIDSLFNSDTIEDT